MMERDWIQEFYKECGREVTLAYNTVNQTNTWGVTLTGIVLASGLMGAARIDTATGAITFTYPNTLVWFYVIAAWVIMIRFFVRSALGVANMWRWNELIFASAKVLSLGDSNPSLGVFQRNLAKKAKAYYFDWKIPRTQWQIVWNNLVLMYIWFLLGILALFIWGVIGLNRDVAYYAGLVIFFGTTLFEVWLFRNYHGLQYEDVHPEQEPDLQIVWQENPRANDSPKAVVDDSRVLLFGFCTQGPYEAAMNVLSNQDVNWLPWSYGEQHIDPLLLADIRHGVTLADRRVAFAGWSPTFSGEVHPIRWGRIDHFVFTNGTLRATILLEALARSYNTPASVTNPGILCSYFWPVAHQPTAALAQPNGAVPVQPDAAIQT